MKQFIVGPVEMYPSTKNILEKGYTYFRTEEYGNMVKNNLSKLANLMGVKDFMHIIYLACSGTGAMEAVIDNCVTKNETSLVINGGTFGHRFCELLEYHNISFDSLDLEWNEELTLEKLEKYNNKNYNYLFVNLHETSTGQLYDIKMLSDFCKKNNMYLIVDAISTFLADDFDMDKYGIDITITSSQKGLCLSAGMSFVAFSERMKKKVIENPNSSSYYFNFKSYFRNLDRGQTPFTPAVSIMYELGDILNLIEQKGGKEAWLDYIEQKCLYFRKKAKELGLTIPNYQLSNMLTPLYFEDINANDIVKTLRDKYQLYVNPCGGELGNRLLRVSHIGNTTIEDIDYLLEKMQLAIEEVRKADVCTVK